MMLLSILIAALTLGASSGTAQGLENIVRRQGDRLVVGSDDQEIWLRGMCIGNNAWVPEQDTSWLYYNHNEQDFANIAAMGMNVIRFYMHYQTFEDDSLPYVYKQTGWDWLDINIEWARRHGLRLTLSMHVPQGYMRPHDPGFGIWTDPENQNRFVALWQAIAERYRTEPVISGYDILNEPITTESIEQWQDLAQRSVDSIRQVDPYHLIIIEPLAGVWGDWGLGDDPATFQFLVADDNVMYEFHRYRPYEYTHGLQGNYPDSSVIYVPDDLEWATYGGETSAVPTGNTGWTLYDGALYQVTDSSLRTVEPVFFCWNNPGTVLFDDFVIREYDSSGQYLRDVRSINITTDSGWAAWSLDSNAILRFEDNDGYQDSACLAITGTGSISAWGGWSLQYPVQLNHYYSISGWMKGIDVGEGSSCGMRIDFQRSPSGQPALFRNREYLEYGFLLWRQFGIDNNVPVNVGEYGTDDSTFFGQGGLNWISDMVEIMTEHDVNFTYHLWENVRARPFLIDWFTSHSVAVAYPTLTLQLVNESVRLNWNPTHASAEYRIESAEHCNGPWTIIATTSNSSYPLAPNSNRKFFRVTARLP